ncbi:MAG: BON domain-containing protein [Planctomycetes bacterium]|nr:BON domain-containing protein [Planctomycetota bacterium]
MESSVRDRRVAPVVDEAVIGLARQTVAEVDELAAVIERVVVRETDGGVRNLSVEVGRSGVLLRGHCETYYCKQLAQQAAMAVPGGSRLTNLIEVH